MDHRGVSDPRNIWGGFGCPLPPLLSPRCVSLRREGPAWLWVNVLAGGDGSSIEGMHRAGGWGGSLLWDAAPLLCRHTLCAFSSAVHAAAPVLCRRSEAWFGPCLHSVLPNTSLWVGWEQSCVPLTSHKGSGKQSPVLLTAWESCWGAALGGGKGGEKRAKGPRCHGRSSWTGRTLPLPPGLSRSQMEAHLAAQKAGRGD